MLRPADRLRALWLLGAPIGTCVIFGTLLGMGCLSNLTFERTAGTFCDNDGACLQGLYCDREEQTCRPRKQLGVACDGVDQCSSGFCVDSVCCDGPCGASCLYCAVPGQEGECRKQLEGEDPRNDCPGTTACADGFCQGAPLWSAQFKGPGLDEAVDVALDNDGNVVVVGTFEGTIELDGTQTAVGGVSDRDVFVAKLEGTTGALLWSATFGSSSDDAVAGVVVDANCNILITGDYEGTLEIFSVVHNAVGMRDAYVVKLGTNGGCDHALSEDWFTAIGGSGDKRVADIALGTAGAVYLVGHSSGQIDFSIPMQAATSTGTEAAWIANIGGNGSPIWGRSIGDQADAYAQRAVAVSADEMGNAVVAINGSGSIDFNLTTPDPAPGSTDDIDLFVAKFDITNGGDVLWRLLFGGVGDQLGSAIAVDTFDDDGAATATGDVWFSGSFEGQLEVPNADPLISEDGLDGFWVKLRENSTYVGADSLAGPFGDEPHGIAVDEMGNAVMVGGFELSILVGSILPLQSAGSSDVFLLKIEPNGNAAWGEPFGGVLSDKAVAVVTAPYTEDGGGDLYVTGSFEGIIQFEATNPITSEGSSDVFVSKFGR
jgi:hypothetical protein